jgi:hypothetical protein
MRKGASLSTSLHDIVRCQRIYYWQMLHTYFVSAGLMSNGRVWTNRYGLGIIPTGPTETPSIPLVWRQQQYFQHEQQHQQQKTNFLKTSRFTNSKMTNGTPQIHQLHPECFDTPTKHTLTVLLEKQIWCRNIELPWPSLQ